MNFLRHTLIPPCRGDCDGRGFSGHLTFGATVSVANLKEMGQNHARSAKKGQTTERHFPPVVSVTGLGIAPSPARSRHGVGDIKRSAEKRT